MIWVALSILVLAWVVRTELRRLARGLATLGTMVENMGNRAAQQRGEPPVLTREQVERIKNL